MTDTRQTPPPPGVWAQARALLHPWRWTLLLALLLVLVTAGVELLPPLIIGRLIDDNLRQGRAEGLLRLAVGYLGALGAVQILRMVITYVTAVVAQGALRRLRVRLFEHLLNLPVAYHDTTPLGDTISRCTTDMETINNLFSLGIIHLLTQLIQLVTVLIAMLALSPPLTLVMVPLLPLVYLITRWFQVRMRDAEREVRRGVGMLNARLQETLSGAEVIRALHWEGRFLQAFRRTLVEALQATNRSVWYGSLYSPVMDILAAATVAVLFVVGTRAGLGLGLTVDTLSVGTLTSFVLLFNRFFEPIIALGEDWGTAQAALAGMERVFQVLRIPAEDTSGVASEGDMPEGEPLVCVEHMTFGYAPGEPVLEDVTLYVPAGRHVAIVGRTGAGKSSLFSLLGGLYQPWEGRICVAGCTPQALTPDVRRQTLGPVPQTAQLFSGTVRQNLLLDDASLPDEALHHALEVSGAAGFVSALPQGLDTPLSDQGGGSGVQLSAGQRQLLALARALVTDPLVLLLDEATASVDSATEALFRAALREHAATRGGAVLTIAHRLATALEADEVVVLRDGRIVEQGTPQALLAAGGLLASLWDLERSGWS